MTTTDKNRYMAEYMRCYRARKAAERAELRAQVEQAEPKTQAMFAKILEAVYSLSERVSATTQILVILSAKQDISFTFNLLQTKPVPHSFNGDRA